MLRETDKIISVIQCKTVVTNSGIKSSSAVKLLEYLFKFLQFGSQILIKYKIEEQYSKCGWIMVWYTKMLISIEKYLHILLKKCNFLDIILNM